MRPRSERLRKKVQLQKEKKCGFVEKADAETNRNFYHNPTFCDNNSDNVFFLFKSKFTISLCLSKTIGLTEEFY